MAGFKGRQVQASPERGAGAAAAKLITKGGLIARRAGHLYPSTAITNSSPNCWHQLARLHTCSQHPGAAASAGRGAAAKRITKGGWVMIITVSGLLGMNSHGNWWMMWSTRLGAACSGLILDQLLHAVNWL
jgi:hypothetical protein